ncbi:MAG: hypothetical protein U9Q84_03435 [Thermodesulfobacteriota bacterium]|nr:hypothetical protein [Thermodesulfobacteriota bacterium]
MNKNFSRNLITIFSILLCLIVFGCGRKAAPVPPGQVRPPAVDDLSSSIDGDMLKLAWAIPHENGPHKKGKIASEPDGFIVYRSKTLLSEPVCKKCPVLFKRIADIPIEEKDVNKKITYEETLEKGYRYIYKVTVYTNTGASGKDSNYIEFDY